MQAEKEQAVAEDSLIDRARALVEGIRARAEQTERERCIPIETIEEFKETGLVRAFQAKRFGGLERPPEEFYKAVIEIGTACGSSAWVLGVLAVHPFQLAQFPVEAQQEVHGDDPNTIISTSYAPTGQAKRVPGGYQVSGRWWFSSACDYGSWVLLGADAPDGNGGRDTRMVFLLPRSDYRIEDDWYVMGLAGTGSKSIIVDDAFVPEYRTLNWVECCMAAGPGLAVNTSPLFRLPFLAVFSGCLVVPAIGAAKGAYLEFCRQAQGRRRGFDRRPVVEDPHLQLRLAQSEAEISGAELQVMEDYREMMALVEAGEKIPLESRARYRWHLVNAIDACSRAVERLFAVSGGRVIYYDNPIQRFYRDILAARQHTANNHDLGASFMAQAALGLPLPEYLV